MVEGFRVIPGLTTPTQVTPVQIKPGRVEIHFVATQRNNLGISRSTWSLFRSNPYKKMLHKGRLCGGYLQILCSYFLDDQ